MEWAYIQIASLVAIVALVAYIARADHLLNKEKSADHS